MNISQRKKELRARLSQPLGEKVYLGVINFEDGYSIEIERENGETVTSYQFPRYVSRQRVLAYVDFVDKTITASGTEVRRLATSLNLPKSHEA